MKVKYTRRQTFQKQPMKMHESPDDKNKTSFDFCVMVRYRKSYSAIRIYNEQKMLLITQLGSRSGTAVDSQMFLEDPKDYLILKS